MLFYVKCTEFVVERAFYTAHESLTRLHNWEYAILNIFVDYIREESRITQKGMRNCLLFIIFVDKIISYSNHCNETYSSACKKVISSNK